MNFDSIKGNWAELKGKFRAKWDRLSDDEIESYKTGDHASFKERIREKYGYSKEKAEQEFDDFKASLEEKKDNLKAKMNASSNRSDQDAHGGDRLN